MQAQLAAIIDDFEQARARMRRVAAATPDDRWPVRAEADRWSVAECIAHLNLTSLAYVQLLRKTYNEHSASVQAPRRYHRDPIGWLIGAFTGPLPRIGKFKFGRVTTRASFVPGSELPRERVVAEFESLQDEQIALTRAAESRPLEKIRVSSPFAPDLSYNVYSCLWLLPRHQHRHLAQAEEVWAPTDRA